MVPGRVLVQRPDTVRTGEQPPVGAAVGQLGDVLGQQGHQVVGQVHRALGPILGRAYLYFDPVLGEPGEDARDVLARLGADTFRKLIAPVPAASPEPEPSASMTMSADCGRDGTYRIDGRCSPCDAAHRAARTVPRRVSPASVHRGRGGRCSFTHPDGAHCAGFLVLGTDRCAAHSAVPERTPTPRWPSRPI